MLSATSVKLSPGRIAQSCVIAHVISVVAAVVAMVVVAAVGRMVATCQDTWPLLLAWDAQVLLTCSEG